jgi:hypothetical protein
LGSSESEPLLRRTFDAPFSRSLFDDCVVGRLAARTIVGTVTSVRGLPMYSVDSEGANGMDDWLVGRGGFTTVPRGISSSLSLLKALIVIHR